jgi:hypothetical protein
MSERPTIGLIGTANRRPSRSSAGTITPRLDKTSLPYAAFGALCSILCGGVIALGISRPCPRKIRSVPARTAIWPTCAVLSDQIVRGAPRSVKQAFTHEKPSPPNERIGYSSPWLKLLGGFVSRAPSTKDSMYSSECASPLSRDADCAFAEKFGTDCAVLASPAIKQIIGIPGSRSGRHEKDRADPRRRSNSLRWRSLRQQGRLSHL